MKLISSYLRTAVADGSNTQVCARLLAWLPPVCLVIGGVRTAPAPVCRQRAPFDANPTSPLNGCMIFFCHAQARDMMSYAQFLAGMAFNSASLGEQRSLAMPACILCAQRRPSIGCTDLVCPRSTCSLLIRPPLPQILPYFSAMRELLAHRGPPAAVHACCCFTCSWNNTLPLAVLPRHSLALLTLGLRPLHCPHPQATCTPWPTSWAASTTCPTVSSWAAATRLGGLCPYGRAVPACDWLGRLVAALQDSRRLHSSCASLPPPPPRPPQESAMRSCFRLCRSSMRRWVWESRL